MAQVFKILKGIDNFNPEKISLQEGKPTILGSQPNPWNLSGKKAKTDVKKT
jgi:hypothetical protein